MRKHWKTGRSVMASVVAVAMVGTLSFAPALASARQGGQDLATGSIATGLPEWAIDDGNAQVGDMSAQAVLPGTYDLRSEGLVTPVKFQNPWGSCWAFGGTSAAEISILSASGKTYGEDDADHMKLDLSERHLTYFALSPVTESVNSDQVGEGLHTFDPSPAEQEANPYAVKDAAFNAGGLPAYLTTLFAQGVGPIVEEAFPYYGATEKTTQQDYDANPEHLMWDIIEQVAPLKDMTFDQLVTLVRERAANEGISFEEALLEEIPSFNALKQLVYDGSSEDKGSGSYTKYDDWSIPETNDQGHPNRLFTSGYVLKNGNVLPEYWNADKTVRQPEAEVAIKQELLNGHGVNIAFHADQAGKYTMSDVDPDTGNSVNNMYNQYVYGDDAKQLNHGVCIVGWDDSYAADNFKKTAPGDGAWIVKNSWGSTKGAFIDEHGNLIGKRNYGFKDADGEYTGCFYLSYYDESIQQVETMEFTQNLGSEGVFAALQHDYMPASQGFYTTPATDEVMSSANVFDSGTESVVLKSVSTRTAETNMRVTFAIYELNENAKDPTDGTLLYRTSQNFKYGGFHRLDLDQPITFEAGKKFSIVTTASVVDPSGTKRSYSASATKGLSEELATKLTTSGISSQKAYSVAVINPGESWLYQDNIGWKDWKDYIDALPPDTDPDLQKLMPDAQRYTDEWAVDNFSIKAYVEPAAEEPIVKTDISDATMTVAKATYNNGKQVKPKVTVKLDGKTLTSGTDYTVSYANNKNAGTAVAIAKGKGDYTGSVVQEFTINKAANTLVASGKTATVKAAKLAKANQVIAKSKAFSISKAKGAVTFKKASGNNKITVAKAGKVTVKKGLGKNTYKVKVKVTAAGDANYKAVTKTVTLKVKVK